MNTRLYANLEAAINEWMELECQGPDWPDVYVGQRTAEMMARAAAAVLDACEESQAQATQPEAPAPALKSLIDKWREQAKGANTSAFVRLTECADDIEAALNIKVARSR